MIFDGLYVADRLSSLLKIGAFLFAALALFYSRNYLARRGMQKGEYYVLSLTRCWACWCWPRPPTC